ncbi:MAG TPA: hypothetical protein VFR70_01560 [Flavobacterium sp.]|nr:hypothetical protein [Flavobacterium sp.]
MASEKEKDLRDKKWNGEQDASDEPVNEGFSSKNIPEDYDPSTGKLTTEIEKDSDGNASRVERARNVEDYNSEAETDSQDLEERKKQENRDRNLDIDAGRYGESHPDNKKSRGNIDFGK